jgi:hypothetical protein
MVSAPGHFLNENCYNIFIVKARLNLKAVFSRFNSSERDVKNVKDCTSSIKSKNVQINIAQEYFSTFFSINTTISVLLCALKKI